VTTDTAQLRKFARKAGWPIRIAVLVGVVLLVIWQVDIGALRAALRPDSWAFVGLAVACNTASVVLKGWSWKGVVDGLPGIRQRTRVRDLVSPLFVGFLFNSVLAARLGEFVKVGLARRRLAVRGETVGNTMLLGTVVVEGLVSTITWVISVFLIGLFLPLSRTIWITTAVAGLVCFAVVVVATLRSHRRHTPPWLSTGPLWARARRAFARLWGAVRDSHVALRSPRQVTAVTVPSFLSWGAQLAGIYCALRAFGLDTVGWSGAGLLLVTVTVAQTFPVLPGNVGVFQAAVVVPLTHTYPVSSASALAFALGLQATEVVVGVVLGFVFLAIEGVSFRQLREEAERDEERTVAKIERQAKLPPGPDDDRAARAGEAVKKERGQPVGPPGRR